jgi:Flp pilus assembly protein TadG
MRSSFLSKLRQFLSNTGGNVAVVFALAVAPVFFMVGASIDYSRAAKARAQLSAIADAAALSATTQAMLAQNASVAQAAATTMFSAQAQHVAGLNYNPTGTNPKVQINDVAAANGVIFRTATVTYAANLANLFPGLDFANQTNFTVTATVNTQAGTNSAQPNTDVYIMADNSPSMELPATSAGIAAMINNTGCALACHENDFTDAEYTSQYPGWGSIDSYTYAQNAGITLRIDSVRRALQDLASSVSSAATKNGATYQLAVYGFNDHLSQIHALSAATAANVATIKSDVSSLTPPVMEKNDYLPSGSTYTYPASGTAYSTVTLTSTLKNHSAMTNLELAMNSINTIIANPGNGTNQSGDSPQKVLVLVTDGVDDATMYNSSYCSTTMPSNTSSISTPYGGFTRCVQPIDTSVCTTIKNRGIRIAVLYVTYYPIPNNGFYSDYVAPNLPQMLLNLQNCASGPNLVFQVNTDGDFSASLLQTVLTSVASAPHLTQ